MGVDPADGTGDVGAVVVPAGDGLAELPRFAGYRKSKFTASVGAVPGWVMAARARGEDVEWPAR